ncbi:uncharacterized protein LOC135826616 [Sycon ciliatum]|uniref:uncharacterized protein LOC135826616 n=1 Tax=Sycon ciliatum TaxID=27933 RepID=UPI0031F6C8D4
MSPLMNNTGNTGQAFKPTSNIMDWLLGGSCIALLIVLVAVGCVLWKRHKAKGQYPLEAEGNLVLENIRQQNAPHDPVQDNAARYVVTGMVNEGSYAAIGADINVRSSTTETAESYYVNARPSREVPQRQNGGVQVAIKPEPASTTAAEITEAAKAGAEAPATARAAAAPVAASATASQSAIGQYSLIRYGLAEDMEECAYDNHIRRGPPSPRFGQTASPSPYEDRYDNHHLLLITGFGPTGVNVSPRASRVDEGLYDNEVIRSQVAIETEPASTTAQTTEATKAAAEAPATAEAPGAAGAEIAPATAATGAVAAATTSQSAIGQYSLITYGLAEDMAECAYDNHIRRGPPSPRFGQTASPSPYEDRYDNHQLLLPKGFGTTGVNVSPRASRVDEGLYDNEVIRSQVIIRFFHG